MILLFAIAFLAVVAGLALKIPFVQTYAYPLGWWSLIGFLESLCRRYGWATAFSRPILSRRNAALCFFSAALWGIFELYDVLIANWHYVAVPENPWIWMPNTFLSFATVMPAILAFENLLSGLHAFACLETRRFDLTENFLSLLVVLGWTLTILPLTQPELFFPFVWGGFTFLLEPWNYRMRDPHSILRQASEGRPGLFLRLLGSGFLCGFLWESLNYFATTKWIYTVPVIGHWKVFEMPVAGYVGFPVFGVEAYVMYRFAFNLYERCKPAGRFLLLLLGFLLIAMTFPAVAQHSFFR